jgi:hypothetical protein
MKKDTIQGQKLFINRQTVSRLNNTGMAGIKGGRYRNAELEGITETLSQLLSCAAGCALSFPPRCVSDAG